MRPLLDTNVLVDVVLTRPGLHEASGAVVVWCKNHPGTAVLTAHSLATVAYLAGRAVGKTQARRFTAELAAGFDIAPVAHAEVSRALALPLSDFEDALIAAAAESASATHIVTRNLSDFRKSPVKAMTPEDFLRLTARA
jgi:predicted nucleic acid-binding protein